MSLTKTVMVYILFTVLTAGALLAPWNDVRAQRSRTDYGDLSQDPPLRLDLGLKVYKKTYLLREPIRVRVSVTNVGKHEGKFSFQTGDALVITDSEGTRYRCQIHIGRVGLSEIEPQETMEREVNLSSFCYGLPHSQFKVFWYLPPEKYTISYRLHQTGVSGGTLFAESPEDTFQVVEAQGADAKALELLVQSYDLYLEKKYQESLEKLHELLEKYPKSGYVPYVTLMAANSIEKWCEVIRRFPESGEAIAAVNSIAHHFANKRDKPGCVDVMNKLINQYPDTDVARAASRLKNTSDRFFRQRSKRDRNHGQEGE